MSRLAALYALRAFEAAARHLSYTRAAEELALTQSAVSRHVRTVENDFGCTLFERQGRGLRLTESGRLLLPGLQQGFAALEAACASLRTEEGVLRLKAPSTLTMRWLLARLSRFRLQQPGQRGQASSRRTASAAIRRGRLAMAAMAWSSARSSTPGFKASASKAASWVKGASLNTVSI